MTLSLVLDAPQLSTSYGIVLSAVTLFAAAAWIFGTALRLPFRKHPLGEPELVVPAEARAGETIEVRVTIDPREGVVIEEAVAELTCVEVDITDRARRTEIHRSSAELVGNAALVASLAIPQNAAPTKEGPPRHRGWTVRVLIVTNAGPDWIAERPIRIT